MGAHRTPVMSGDRRGPREFTESRADFKALAVDSGYPEIDEATESPVDLA